MRHYDEKLDKGEKKKIGSINIPLVMIQIVVLVVEIQVMDNYIYHRNHE
jgi:hypothetical protein